MFLPTYVHMFHLLPEMPVGLLVLCLADRPISLFGFCFFGHIIWFPAAV